jgi:hypothetical protein
VVYLIALELRDTDDQARIAKPIRL